MITFKAPVLSKELAPVQRSLEGVQMELLMQARRQDDSLNRIGRTEADLSRVAKLTVESEDLRAADRQQRHQAIKELTRRTEDVMVTSEALRSGQEHLNAKLERLEVVTDESHQAGQSAVALRQEVSELQMTVREKLEAFGHALRRIDAMERVYDDNVKLRAEVVSLRRTNERRDLEIAAMQGHIDALTKLVRERLKDPTSPSSHSRGL